MTAPRCSGREGVFSVSKRESIGRGRAGAFGGVESRHDQTEPGHVWRSEERETRHSTQEAKSTKGQETKMCGLYREGLCGMGSLGPELESSG